MGGSAAGGTGQTFDWTIAKTIQEGGLPLFVAGGASLTRIFALGVPSEDVCKLGKQG